MAHDIGMILAYVIIAVGAVFLLGSVAWAVVDVVRGIDHPHSHQKP